MKDLIIITTKPEFLPDSGKESILFSRGNCDRLPAKALATFSEYRADSFCYRLKENDSLIFGTCCLNDDIRKDKILPEKDYFLPSILKDVSAILSPKEKKSIARLFFVVHGFDISSNEKSFSVEDRPELLSKLNESKIFEDREMVKGELDKQVESNLVSTFFIGFSHVPGLHAFYDVLSRPYIFINSNLHIDVLTSKIIEHELRFIENDWMRNWEIPQKSLSLPAAFRFNFYYTDEYNDIEDATKANFPFSPLRDFLMPLSKNTGYLANIVFVNIVSLAAHKNTKGFRMLESLFGKFHDLRSVESCKIPTLFIGYKDIMPDSDAVLSEGIRLDRRYRFLDSSIWYRYVALEKTSTNDFLQSLLEALDTIAWAYENHLYEKNVCREYLEFNNRLLRESKLHNFGDGHALSIFPFVFHSETVMGKKAAELAQQFEKNQLKWNFLFIDDYAELPLREGQESESDKRSKKGEIVTRLLERPPVPLSTTPSQTTFAEKENVKMCKSVPESIEKYFGENALESKNFLPDILLLDYLFSNPRDKQHYGTDLLKAIEKGEARQGRSVQQSYWVHPTTVFNEAMLSDLQEKSYQHFEKYWFLARGADPINTPCLFRRSLFEFMQVQAEKLIFDESDLWLFLARQRFNDKKDETPVSRTKAQGSFRNFIERFSVDEGIDERSAIGTSAKRLMLRNGAMELRDHIRQLLYLFAYTSGYDFPVMENEFKQIDKHYQLLKNKQGTPPELLEELDKTLEVLSKGVYSIRHKYF